MIFLDHQHSMLVVEVEVLILVILVTLAQVVKVVEDSVEIREVDNQDPLIQVVAVVE